MSTSASIKASLLIMGLAAVVIMGWMALKAQGADLMPIRYVRVEGAFQYMSKQKIKQVLNEQVMYGFFNVNLGQLRDAIKTLPWANEVAVKRVWPDAIKVEISEQEPVARWRADWLINNEGELFNPDNIAEFNQLPLINGPEQQQVKFLEIWKGLRVALEDQALELKAFHVDERRAWRLELNNDMAIIMGRIVQLKNMRRFLDTLDLLGTDVVRRMATVDLRYPNGFAVGWKKEAGPIDWKQMMKPQAS